MEERGYGGGFYKEWWHQAEWYNGKSVDLSDSHKVKSQFCHILPCEFENYVTLLASHVA